jgi:hypothetical protein
MLKRRRVGLDAGRLVALVHLDLVPSECTRFRIHLTWAPFRSHAQRTLDTDGNAVYPPKPGRASGIEVTSNKSKAKITNGSFSIP